MIRYRFDFVGTGELPPPDHVCRDAPIIVGTVARCTALISGT